MVKVKETNGQMGILCLGKTMHTHHKQSHIIIPFLVLHVLHPPDYCILHSHLDFKVFVVPCHLFPRK